MPEEWLSGVRSLRIWDRGMGLSAKTFPDIVIEHARLNLDLALGWSSNYTPKGGPRMRMRMLIEFASGAGHQADGQQLAKRWEHDNNVEEADWPGQRADPNTFC
ncbi:hypothetical protein ACLKA7_008805 [Drosophila subpalustris]